MVVSLPKFNFLIHNGQFKSYPVPTINSNKGIGTYLTGILVLLMPENSR